MKQKKYIHTIMLLCLILLLGGCSSTRLDLQESDGDTTASESTNVESTTTSLLSFAFTQEDYREEVYDATLITLSNNSASVEGIGVSVVGSIITISAAGDYEITGTLDDGQIIVDADSSDDVHILLNGASISNSTGSPFVILQADKTILSLAEGSINSLEDAAVYTQVEDEANATLYSKDDLTINGCGELFIYANSNHGIYSQNDLRIVNASIRISAENDGLKGIDKVWIVDATLYITAKGDGIQSSNADSSDVGNILIENTSINIEAGLDGIQAENMLQINSGTFDIISGSLMSSEGSGKGLKAVNQIILVSGDYYVNSKDDTINAERDVFIEGGNYILSSGDDGIHANSSLTISGGDITIVESYEGLESQVITINEGSIHLTSFDDGINGTTGGGAPVGVEAGNVSVESVMVTINGGLLVMDSAGDGLDSNGSIVMNDGLVIIFGPETFREGAVDYNGNFTLEGGTILAIGASAMAQQATDTHQNTLLVNFDGAEVGDVISIIDDSDSIIVSIQASKTFNSIVYSGENLTTGDYKIISDGTTDVIYSDGVAFAGNISAYTLLESFSISSSITAVGEVAMQQGPMGTRQAPPARN